MRHLRTYRLFENQEKLFSDKEMEEAKISLYDRIKGIIEGKIKPSKIRDVFGLEYADSIENVDDDDFDDDKLEFCANLKCFGWLFVRLILDIGPNRINSHLE